MIVVRIKLGSNMYVFLSSSDDEQNLNRLNISISENGMSIIVCEKGRCCLNFSSLLLFLKRITIVKQSLSNSDIDVHINKARLFFMRKWLEVYKIVFIDFSNKNCPH